MLSKLRPITVLLLTLLLASSASGLNATETGDSGEKYTYIVLQNNEISQQKLDDLGVETVFDYSIIEGKAVKASPEAADTMSSFSSVDSVRPDIPVFLPVMDGDGDDTSRDHYGGSGTVAVLDTGVDNDHVDLDEAVIENTDVREGKNDPDDYQGHGTHVASILAGSGDGNSKYTGVAPKAKVRNYKVLDDTGSGEMSAVIKGVEEASKDSDVMVLSLGAKVDECDGSDPLSKAVTNAAEKGVAVVVAAGNEGPETETITSPGCAKKAFSIGASYKEKKVPDYSSRGPTFDGRSKPDIVVEGSNIMAAEAQTKNEYTSKTGTSMAAPFAAGAVAILMDEEEASNTDYYSAIKETSFTLDEPRNAEGHGNANITAAANYMTQENSDSGNQNGSNGSRESETGSDSDSTDQGTRKEEAETLDSQNIIDRIIKLLNSLLNAVTP